jgi:hypothetical protein
VLTFRLKYLFCLVLIVGVALMWGVWYSSLDDPTASRLLAAKEKSEAIPKHLDMFDASGILGLEKWEQFVSTGGTATETSQSSTLLNRVDTDWNKSVFFEVSSYEKDQTNCSVSWQADWPAIEAKAADENWTFYRQVIMTILAVLTIGWVFIRSRR